MPPDQPCTVAACGKPGAASLGKRSFCTEHFISACYGRIDEFNHRLGERPFRDTNAEAVRHFVAECTREAADLAHHKEYLDNLERARLLDIVLQASDLVEHLRRSPRIPDSRLIRLRSDGPEHPWEENTRTVTISRYGAAVLCHHPVEIDQKLLATRSETGREARARVVFRQPRNDGGTEIGIEFLECDDFWD